MKEEVINKIRQFQMLITVFIFIGVTVQCWTVTGFDITKIQISQWGADDNTGWLWNGVILLVATATLFNVIIWISHHQRLKYKKFFYFAFTLMSLLLFMVGIFPTGTFKWLHDIPAITYFFTYPLIIFTMAFLNRKSIKYSEWVKHVAFSALMVTLPLTVIWAFEGKAISEILHTTMVAAWNISLLGINKNKIKTNGTETSNQV